MAKVTNADIIALGFTKDMFHQITDQLFATYIDAVIAEVSDILSARVGAATYASTTLPTSVYVKRAEKCLVAAEMWDRRMNILMGAIVGTNLINAQGGKELLTTYEKKQRDDYLAEAEGWLGKILSSDFATGSVLSTHFEDPAILTGY